MSDAPQRQHNRDTHAVLATADYGYVFPTIVGEGNVIGAQFHPEKSQRAGIELLSAFARWTP